MQVFYSQQINLEKTILSEEESHHATHVLRMRIGEKLLIMNGNGELFSGIIQEIGKKNTSITHLELVRKEEPPAHKIILYISPLKNTDRLEWLVEKATELGVSEIYPMISKNSVSKKINAKRLQQIALSASKQCLRLYIPVIHELMAIKDLRTDVNAVSVFGFCGAIEKKKINHIDFQKANINVLIGPEGDFTIEEANELIAKKILPVDLGNNRLRSETAAMFALSSIKFQLL